MLKTTWNLPEQSAELTQKLTTGKAVHIATNAGHYYEVIIEGL